MNLENKLFREVFPGLKLDKKIEELLGQTRVEKITMFQSQKKMVISISSDILIAKSFIYRAEAQLAEFVFDKQNATVKIEEHYTLSKQYGLRQLTEIYKDSFLEEIKNTSFVAYRLLKRGEWYYDGNVLTFALEDTNLSRSHADMIREYFVTTYKERFDMEVSVGFDYTEEQKTSLREANKLRLQQELRAIELEQGTADSKATETKEQSETAPAADAVSNDGAPAKAETSSEPKEVTQKAKEKTEKQPAKGQGYGKDRKGAKTSSYDPEVFYGRNCEGDVVKICDVYDGIGPVCMHGQVLMLEDRELRSGKFIVSGTITDFTDTISFKLFINPEDREPLLEELSPGKFYLMKGVPMYDTYTHEISVSSITGFKHANDFREKRMDTSIEKRVELHLHTTMSEMDSVVDIEKVIKRAKEWGHKAMAITDHGVVQAFPIANHCVKPDEDFKII